jgi:hypothetical protein
MTISRGISLAVKRWCAFLASARLPASAHTTNPEVEATMSMAGLSNMVKNSAAKSSNTQPRVAGHHALHGPLGDRVAGEPVVEED